jgi:hypothetical protein
MRTIGLALALALVACGGAQTAKEIGTNRLKVEWRSAAAAAATAKVTFVVEGQPQELGTLSTAADSGANGACRIRKTDVNVTEFACGATSSYNYFVAELKGGQLIVTLVTGVNDDPNAEERKIVSRADVSQTSFTVLPYAPTAP